MQQYILTGGPGCGKTSAIYELEAIYDKYIIHESAESTIRRYQAKGIMHPWKTAGFQTEIWKLNRKRINAIPSEVKEVFHDRYYIDCIAYARYENVMNEIPKDYIQQINTNIPTFFFEQLDFLETNKVRREDQKIAEEMSKRTLEEYKNHGFEIIIVKKGSLYERVRFIVEYIKNVETQ